MFSKADKLRFKVGALVAVYILRMLLVQSLIASPSVSHISTFKVSLSQHQSKNCPHVPPTHRNHIHKHGNAISRVSVVLPSSGIQHTSIIVSEPQKNCALKLYNPPVYTSIKTDALKRFRLHRSFLI